MQIQWLKRLAGGLALACAVLTAAPSTAQPVFPTPEEVLERAKIDRFEFSDTIEELRGLLPYMKTREVLFQYVDILDELKVIEIALNFPIFDQSPLTGFAGMLSKVTFRTLGASAAPINLLTDPQDTVHALIQWGDDEDRELFIRQQLGVLGVLDNVLDVRVMFDRYLAAVEHLDSLTPPINVFQIEKLNQTQGIFFARYIELAGAGVRVEDVAALAARMRARYGFTLALDRLLSEAIMTPAEARLRQIILIASTIRDALQTTAGHADVDVMRKPGVIVGYIIGKLLQIEATLTEAETERAIATLDESQLSQLVLDLSRTDFDWLRPHQLPFLLRLGVYVVARLNDFGQYADRERAEAFLDKVRFFEKMSDEVLLDGLFDVRIDGRPGKMSFVRSGSVEVGVGIQVGTITYVLGYARYEHQTDEFVASNLPYTQGPIDGQPLYNVRLRFSPDGRTVSGVLDTGLRVMELTGDRVETYHDFFRREPTRPERFVGTYRGTIELGGQRRDVRFSVVRHGANAIGYSGVLHVAAAGGPMRIEFSQHYSNYRNNVMYLTEREGDHFAFRRLLQIRGYFTETGFVGTFIRGATDEVWKLELTRSAN